LAGDRPIHNPSAGYLGANVKLNLGCGFRKQDGYINIDIDPRFDPDLVLDITSGLPYKDDSVDEVRAVDFLEHIPIGRVIPVIEDIYRVLENNGVLYSLTPSTDGRGAFQDPTHVSFWNINSWIYYMDDSHRDLYGIKAKFEGSVTDIQTNEKLKIIHTRCILKAVKPCL